MTLIGSTALVTGGSQGIGLQISRGLVQAGADVFIVARRQEVIDEACERLRDDAEQAGVRVAGMSTDVSVEAEVNRAVAAAHEAFGAPVQILVNSAGVGHIYRLLDLPAAGWDEIFNIHVKGTFLTVQAVARELRAAQLPGSFINITSLNANTPTAGLAHYCAAKAAVSQFTEVAAIELAPHGIRVNSVAPGAVVTPLVEPYLNSAMREGYLTRTPLGRLGQPNDIAQVVTFLASTESHWIDGAAIPVDGGAHMMGLHSYADAIEQA